MSTTTNTYQPGVCNIGPAEIRMRRNSGIAGAVITVVALVAFVLFHVPDSWRAFVVLPAGLGASGFLQAAFHFCARFGMTGLFNFGDLGTQERVHAGVPPQGPPHRGARGPRRARGVRDRGAAAMSAGSTVIGTNWAGYHEYRATTLHRPTSVDELQSIVAAAPRIRALGSRQRVAPTKGRVVIVAT